MERIKLHIDGNRIAWVALNRGEQHNAVDLAMLKAMRTVQRRLRRAGEVRGAIIHGEGPSFCSGLDFRSLQAARPQAALAALSLWLPWRNRFQDWSMGWRELPFPVIAAIHGHCYGAGLQLALGADLRIARADAKLALMEAKWGLVPDMGGPTLLRELMPIDRAKDLVFGGRVADAEEALRLNLVSRLEDDPLAAAQAQLEAWNQRSPDALAAGKFLLQEAWHAGEDEALAGERRRQRSLIGRANQLLAMKAGLGRNAETPRFRTRRIRR